MKLKASTIVICIACTTITLLTLDGCEKTPEVKPHKPGSETRPDIEDATLPEKGELTKYSPSKRTTFYYPIMVDCYNVTKYVENTFNSNYTPMKARVLANMQGFTADETTETYKQKTNKYGSSTSLPRQTATGRFYVKKIDGRWWIVDPEGYLHHHRGVNSFRPGEKSDRQIAGFRKQYGGNTDIWLTAATTEMRNMGFHSAGAFTPINSKIRTYNSSHKDTPFLMCPSFHFLTEFKTQYNRDYPNGNEKARAVLILDGQFEEFCKKYAKSQVTPYKNDANVVGVFSDNEIEFINIGSGESNRILPISLKYGGAITSKARKWCTDNGINPDSSTQTGNWTNNCKFAGYLAELYYKAVSEAIKAVDPKLLYLGTRLHGDPRNRQEIWAAAGKYCDIVSVNYYGDWSPDLSADGSALRAPGKAAEGRVAQWEEWSGKPCLVSEFYTKGVEDSNLANTNGAGFATRNQATRAYAYQHFTLGLLEATNVVGWHWFRYQDDDGDDNNGEHSNKGIYDNNLKMYEYLGRYMRNLNIHVYELIEFFDAKQ